VKSLLEQLLQPNHVGRGKVKDSIGPLVKVGGEHRSQHRKLVDICNAKLRHLVGV
jgi:hypothetical protein